jgi:hypothetical protein
MGVVVDLVVNCPNCDVCAIRVVAAAITNGSYLKPVITSKSVRSLKRPLSDWLRNEA